MYRTDKLSKTGYKQCLHLLRKAPRPVRSRLTRHLRGKKVINPDSIFKYLSIVPAVPVTVTFIEHDNIKLVDFMNDWIEHAVDNPLGTLVLDSK